MAGTGRIQSVERTDWAMCSPFTKRACKERLETLNQHIALAWPEESDHKDTVPTDLNGYSQE
jgi:erythromycin esterase-like protein